MTFCIYTLGCKVNYYESECISSELEALGLKKGAFSAPCDVYIINSCTVTAESDRKVMQIVRRAAAANPEAFICVTGCTAQTDPGRIAGVKEVAYICGNADKRSVVGAVKEFMNKKFSGEAAKTTAGNDCKAASVPEKTRSAAGPVVNVPPFGDPADFEPMKLVRTEHTRAIIKIEDGCNSACSYCIIHTARGPARSKKEEDILAEIRDLANAGYKEFVLTGIELSSYSGDLGALAAKAGNIPGAERIRLGSLDPFYITKKFTDSLAAAGKVMPHFHISLQSGSDRILNSMRRKYTAARALENIEYLKERFPSACLFADIIVGFPGETDEDFAQTVEFIKKVRFLHLHIFPYSRRPGTPAAQMPHQVPAEVKKRRAAELASIQAGIKAGILDGIVRSGRTLNVLCETGGSGHSDEFIEIKAENARGKDVRGKVFGFRPLYSDGDVLHGDLLF